MPTFVLMTRISAEALQDASDRRASGKRWLNKVQTACPQVKWLGHYEAPDAETAARVSLISRASGALSAESWQAMPYDSFLRLLEEVQE